MDKKVKKLWTDALRSGDYKQGNGSFKDFNGDYCCLGVLACVLDKEGLLPEGYEILNEPQQLLIQPGNMYGTFYRGFSEAIGLPEYYHDKLYRMNDRGESFSEIATYIDQFL